MSESPPNPGEFDDVDEHYRRVTALEKGGPSESVRRAQTENDLAWIAGPRQQLAALLAEASRSG